MAGTDIPTTIRSRDQVLPSDILLPATCLVCERADDGSGGAIDEDTLTHDIQGSKSGKEKALIQMACDEDHP